MRPDLEKLIQACKALERKEQRQMVDLLVPFLSNICRRYALSRTDQQDLIQESLIQIFNHIDQFAGVGQAFFAWSKRIAVNICLQKIRKQKVQLEEIDLYSFDLPSDPNIFSKLGVEEILQIIGSLPENQRLVFNLFVIDGYPHQQIAEMLQIQESHSRALLSRARAALQHLLIAKEILVK